MLRLRYLKEGVILHYRTRVIGNRFVYWIETGNFREIMLGSYDLRAYFVYIDG